MEPCALQCFQIKILGHVSLEAQVDLPTNFLILPDTWLLYNGELNQRDKRNYYFIYLANVLNRPIFFAKNVVSRIVRNILKNEQIHKYSTRQIQDKH
jgi:hypothetical protein